MNGLPADFLDRSPQEAARRIALLLLERADAASDRLEDPDDSEALHDFRVAVRRLRSAFSLWRKPLGKGARKVERDKLKKLHTRTGASRDAEVGLAWLLLQQDTLSPEHGVGFEFLRAELEVEAGSDAARVKSQARAGYRKWTKRVRPQVARLRINTDLTSTDAARFRPMLAGELEKQLNRVLILGEGLRLEDNSLLAHELRIATKRLRYLADSVVGIAAEAKTISRECKRLQEVLGDLNDATVLDERVRVSMGHAAEQRAKLFFELAGRMEAGVVRQETALSERPGLHELRSRLTVKKSECFLLLRSTFIESNLSGLTNAVRATKQAIFGEEDTEIERKYLLSALPEFPADTVSTLIEQGWIPGTKIHERMRRKVRNGEEKFYRTIKFGQGIKRIEYEEQVPKEQFEQMWALTVGCRIRKRRYVVEQADGSVWEVDDFLDRKLVLAEMELSSVDVEPEIPEWLAPVFLGEVTDDSRYVNLNLALEKGVPETPRHLTVPCPPPDDLEPEAELSSENGLPEDDSESAHASSPVDSSLN